MAAVKVTPPNDFPLGLIRSHMVVIHLFLMLCDLQRVVRDSVCVYIYIYIYIYIYSTNIPPIMIINKIYDDQNLLSL
jgi:hypothetical protein